MFTIGAGFSAFGDLAPRRHELLPAAATLGFTLTTTIWMVDRVLGNTTINRTDAAMARTTRLAENDLLMLRITDLANGRVADFVDLANLT